MAALVLQGCIKEDLAGCDFTLMLNFEQFSDCQTIPRYPSGLNRISVFVFDHDGLFLNQLTILNPATGPSFTMPVSLPKGTYTLVAWAGYTDGQLDPDRLIKGGTSASEAHMLSYTSRSDIQTASSGQLFYGILNDVTISSSSGPVRIINLTQKTKPLNINLGGTGLSGTGNYQLIIDQNAAHFGFDNATPQVDTEHPFTVAPFQPEPSIKGFICSTNLVWPLVNNTTSLLVQDAASGNTLYHLSIPDLLSKLPQVDFSCASFIDININYLSDVQVEVSLNGWKVIELDSEI